MDNGKIIQLGTQDEIIHQPVNRTVARLTGTENIFDGTVIERNGVRKPPRTIKLKALPLCRKTIYLFFTKEVFVSSNSLTI